MYRFTLVAVVGGCPYTRVKAGSKKDCRSGAAYLAWKAIIHNQQEQVSGILIILFIRRQKERRNLVKVRCFHSIVP